jgi:sporulation protein YlmC with PRC-barrel domain
LVSTNLLMGKKVVGLNGDSIGEVKDVDYDMVTWQITDLQLKLSDKGAMEFGIKKTAGSMGPVSVTRGSNMVYMPVNLISAVGDVITIKKSLFEITEGHLVKKYSE